MCTAATFVTRAVNRVQLFHSPVVILNTSAVSYVYKERSRT